MIDAMLFVFGKRAKQVIRVLFCSNFCGNLFVPDLSCLKFADAA